MKNPLLTPHLLDVGLAGADWEPVGPFVLTTAIE
jgi:hypothetical protein